MAGIDQVSLGETTYELVPEIAPLFDNTKAYAIGDYVIKDAALYRFKSAHAAGAWVGTDVEEVTVASELTELKADLGTYSEFAFFTPTIDEVQRNLTFSITNDGKLKVYGSPSAARRLCCLNGQDVIKTTSGEFAKTLDAGTYVISTAVTGYSSYVRWDYTYTTFASYNILVTNENSEITITFKHPVMIGFTFGQVQEENYGTSENPTYITFSAKKLTALDAVARKSIESLQVAEGTAWTE